MLMAIVVESNIYNFNINKKKKKTNLFETNNLMY